ncbi:hypothetical protein BEL05_02595 [Shewanella colwelliana]|uniref:HTH tetR-type domain-containing protein n=1 Tax=Shewanella colwelliana TaxID=23 RepID=A0A1E5IXF8_SHECO|nr:TetR/AcrR family transcriptional regulator [Shewanella colwelliana]OEG75164.1 hypothetical protein BEL05_02595 [Shewanella colwelliana]
MQQGEVGQGDQTKQNIVAALMQSLRSVTYQQVKVGDLMRRAAIGRSTFYRHFSSKLDVLLLLHSGRFEQMLSDYQTESDWLAEQAGDSLRVFIKQVKTNSQLRRSLGYTLGADREMATNKITLLIEKKIEASLRKAFGSKALTIPFSILSLAIAANIHSQVKALKEQVSANDIDQFIDQLHRLNRGLITAALPQDL